MAQTKTRSKPKSKSQSKPKPQSKSKSQSKPKARSSSGKARKANSTRKTNTASRSNSRSKATMSKPKAVVESVEETAKDAGHAVGNAAGKAGHAVGDAASKAGHAVGKAKVPLMAGGAALAGVAGGLALGSRQMHRHRGIGIKGSGALKNRLEKVDSDDLAKAVRKVGDFSAQLGELALEAKRIREESNGKANRSPIEVVLDGLTARRGAGRR